MTDLNDLVVLHLRLADARYELSQSALEIPLLDDDVDLLWSRKLG